MVGAEIEGRHRETNVKLTGRGRKKTADSDNKSAKGWAVALFFKSVMFPVMAKPPSQASN